LEVSVTIHAAGEKGQTSLGGTAFGIGVCVDARLQDSKTAPDGSLSPAPKLMVRLLSGGYGKKASARRIDASLACRGCREGRSQ
jgi:hypothetical protein